MRREMMRAPREEALALLERAPWVHIASATPEGRPVLRAVHCAISDGALCFHGAPVGEKTALDGREAVAAYEELVAEIPSYWTDPEMACPATSLYVSVQAHGTLRRIADGPTKSRALQALMEKHQPEGGHAPIAYEDERYRKPVDGVALWALSLDAIDRKDKLAQNRAPEYVEAVVERLWARGSPGDSRAIALLLRANPSARIPVFLQGPEGSTVQPWEDPRAMPDALPLLRHQYWNASRFDDEAIARAHRGSSAWVTLRDAGGALVATARAVTDGVKYGYVGDVAVRDDWRGRGAGAAVMRALLAHPAVRGARRIELATRDATAFYQRLGFALTSTERQGEHARHTMALVRS